MAWCQSHMSFKYDKSAPFFLSEYSLLLLIEALSLAQVQSQWFAEQWATLWRHHIFTMWLNKVLTVLMSHFVALWLAERSLLSYIQNAQQRMHQSTPLYMQVHAWCDTRLSNYGSIDCGDDGESKNYERENTVMVSDHMIAKTPIAVVFVTHFVHSMLNSLDQGRCNCPLILTECGKSFVCGVPTDPTNTMPSAFTMVVSGSLTLQEFLHTLSQLSHFVGHSGSVGA